jgi:hypothetical protein
MLLTRYRDPGIIPRGLEFSHNPGAPSFPLAWLFRVATPHLPRLVPLSSHVCCRSDRVRVVVGGGLSRQTIPGTTNARSHQRPSRSMCTAKTYASSTAVPVSTATVHSRRCSLTCVCVWGLLCPTRLMQTRATFTDHREPFTAPCATTASTASTTTISFSTPFASSSLSSSPLVHYMSSRVVCC